MALWWAAWGVLGSNSETSAHEYCMSISTFGWMMLVHSLLQGRTDWFLILFADLATKCFSWMSFQQVPCSFTAFTSS